MADLDPDLLEALQMDDPTGFNKFLGLRYGEISGASVAAELAVTEDHLQPHGIVHGGIYASVVETLPSVGGTVWLGGKGYCVGVHNATDFFRPTRAGATLRAKAVPVHQGKSQQLWRVEIVNDEGKLAAAGELRVHNIYFGEGGS
ncbi:MAG: PaaI family thioesterase [Segniliparus sp.]|uniref:PaaI family thioesterase n=1 Tax=Segniliparus sp. TaxID=2804064 RepID=UPI003F2FE251